MFTILISLFFVLLLLVLSAKYWQHYQQQRQFPYQRRYSLLTPTEQQFMQVLQQAVAGQYQIFVQVRLADVLTVKADSRQRLRAQGLINSKHFDFVLCQAEGLVIVCAIELDDSSHQLKHRQQRDVFVDTACQVAGLPLLRVPVQPHYNSDQLRQQIGQLIQQAPPQNVAEHRPPTCPLCQQTMVKRSRKHDQHLFWGCSDYPRCKGTLNISPAAELDQ